MQFIDFVNVTNMPLHTCKCYALISDVHKPNCNDDKTCVWCGVIYST